ncbi:hypothetical protein FQA39_LY07008 [Lamprigera yunnana]|nr:hypothetical protein FQA39_LY07008 [Lamprigera yunnana]
MMVTEHVTMWHSIAVQSPLGIPASEPLCLPCYQYRKNSSLYLIHPSMELLPVEITLRSHHSRNKVTVRMINFANCEVDILWINYDGHYVRYGNLGHNSFIDIDTFETHPWIAVDSKKQRRLLINKNFVYFPQLRVRNRQSQENSDRRNASVVLKITAPLYSLRCRSLLEVTSYIKDIADVDTLDLPREILVELKSLMSERKRYPWINS